MPSEPIREVTVLGAGVMGGHRGAPGQRRPARAPARHFRQGRARRRQGRAQQDRGRRPGRRAQGQTGGVLLAPLRHAGQRRKPGGRPWRRGRRQRRRHRGHHREPGDQASAVRSHRRDGRPRRHHVEHVGPPHRGPDADAAPTSAGGSASPTSSTRPATSSWSRLSPAPTQSRRRSRAPRPSAVASWARGWCTRRTRPTSSPTASARSR